MQYTNTRSFYLRNALFTHKFANALVYTTFHIVSPHSGVLYAAPVHPTPHKGIYISRTIYLQKTCSCGVNAIHGIWHQRDTTEWFQKTMSISAEWFIGTPFHFSVNAEFKILRIHVLKSRNEDPASTLIN